MSIRSTPSSTARRSTRSAFSRSSGQPRIFGPVTRIAPNPSRRTSRSPPIRIVAGTRPAHQRTRPRRPRPGSDPGHGREVRRRARAHRGVDLGAALGAREVDPLLDGVGALAGRAEDDRGDAGRREESRVGPEGDADDLRLAGVAGDELGDRRVRGRLERLPRDDDADLAVDLPEQLPELSLDQRVGLPGDRPALALEEAALRVAGELPGRPRSPRRGASRSRAAGASGSPAGAHRATRCRRARGPCARSRPRPGRGANRAPRGPSSRSRSRRSPCGRARAASRSARRRSPRPPGSAPRRGRCRCSPPPRRRRR